MKRIITTIAVAIALVSCRQATENKQIVNLPLIRVTSVRQEKMTFPVRTSGIVVPAREFKLSFKTGGIIRMLYADEGNRVKKGTLLASLDMEEIDAQVKQAVIGYEKALRDYTRAKNLFTDSVATLEQLQNAETALNVSKALADAARFNQQHSSIYAPEDGVILKKLYEIQEITSAGYPVYVLGTTGQHWKIKAGLADRDYVLISTGDTATVTFDAYPDEKFKAIVSQLNESANPSTGTYELELDLQSVSKKIATGFIAKVEIIPSKAASYFRIPVESLTEAEGKTGYVYQVADSSIVKKIRVEIAEITDKWIAVSTGLIGEEVLATEGSAYLKDGDSVKIIR